MRIENMIYIYGAVCASMILFNLVYNLLLTRSQPRMERRCRRIKAGVEAQLQESREKGQINPSHLSLLGRRLRRINNLIAFNRALEELFEGRPEEKADYLHQIQSVMLSLALVYRTRNDMQAAYFAYFLSRTMQLRQMPIDSLQDIMLDYIGKHNLYCRVNGLNALYDFGTAERVAQALRIQDDGTVFLHEKILTEGLLSYKGDHDELIHILWSRLYTYSTHTRLAILNYIRFRSGDYCREMFSIMQDGREDKELRLSAIRYFGKYVYPPALNPLLTFLADPSPEHWEYATVAASSLANYAGERVISALTKALHSSSWYIRSAASQSLEHHHVNYSDLIDVVAGQDRYAREMITYRLESRKLRKQEVTPS